MSSTKTLRNILRCLSILCILHVCVIGSSSEVFGDWRDDVGYTHLKNILGPALPNGEGVPISLVEALQTQTNEGGTVTRRNYKPNLGTFHFTAGLDPLGESVPLDDGSNNSCSGSCIDFSTHANDQARNFFGNTTSVAPAANQVTLYEANHYLDKILNVNVNDSAGNNQAGISLNLAPPETQDFRVQNFSWVGTYVTLPPAGQTKDQMELDEELDNDHEALRRFDYAIEANNITAVVGLQNSLNPLPRLLSHSYNSIAVGRTSGLHGVGLTHFDRYGSIGRSKPDLVAPQTSTSAATSSTSSIATFLHSIDTVQGTEAANSETIKAILQAGASKTTLPDGWSHIDENDQWHPLDDRYGAGEVNLLNSYLVTLGGRTVGSTSTPAPEVTSHGWDYQVVQPGDENRLLYDFVIPEDNTAAELSIALTWNAKIEGPFNEGDPIVANLDLELVDANMMTVDFNLSDGVILDGLSNSQVDNVEHIYLTDLAAGTYTLRVSSEDLFDDDGLVIPESALASEFGLAWRTSRSFDVFSTDFDEDGDTDGADFLSYQRGFGTLASAPQNIGDADGDGDVDADDLDIISTSFSLQPASQQFAGLAAVASVPEPATLGLALAGCLLLTSILCRQVTTR